MVVTHVAATWNHLLIMITVVAERTSVCPPVLCGRWPLRGTRVSAQRVQVMVEVGLLQADLADAGAAIEHGRVIAPQETPHRAVTQPLLTQEIHRHLPRP